MQRWAREIERKEVELRGKNEIEEKARDTHSHRGRGGQEKEGVLHKLNFN